MFFLREAFSASFDLARAKATGTDRNCLVLSVDNGADLSDIRLPGSAGFAVGVGNIVSECNAFAAIHTFCHICTPPFLKFI